ncbi:hypothetical protein C9374_006681 [Naegleria lovaniensis]|uniref:CWH43-like N-terminal domain-containing protein n=1 Tax=Naegleria lovaniensis TaxID=51637 RepID=A0AA88GL80_NAELO|nr:uncharacterized protein C9374_006681 [Naegleria lovaniensis]KAG2379564.1 hypothetical protein C9374_006681 [Naegleria lovaniensis]
MAGRESILNSVPSQYFPLSIVLGTVATIATTYTLSTYQGHTQPFPYTDITHTARFTPERYIFRVGMLWMAVVMAWNWNILFNWLWNVNESIRNVSYKLDYIKTRHHEDDHAATNDPIPPAPSTTHHILHMIFYLGLASCVSITISSMCITSNSDMPWTLHVIGASSFFVFCLIAQTLTTYKCYKLYKELEQVRSELSQDEALACSELAQQAKDIVFISRKSLYTKLTITGLTVGVLVVNVLTSVVSSGNGPLMFSQLSPQTVQRVGMDTPSMGVANGLSKINLNGGEAIIGSGLKHGHQPVQENTPSSSLSAQVLSAASNAVLHAASAAMNYDPEARLKSTASNIVEWTCTLLIIVYFTSFVFDWSAAKIVTQVGQLFPSSNARRSARPLSSPSNPNAVQTTMQHNPTLFRPVMFNHQQPQEYEMMQHHSPQQVYVFPASSSRSSPISVSSSQQQHASLYPSAYNIQ